MWTTDTSRRLGSSVPIFSTGPHRDSLRSSGLWRTSFNIACKHNDVFLFWIMWILCAGPGGSYTNTPAGPELQAGIWTSSTGRKTEGNLWAVNFPPCTGEFSIN